MKTTDSSPPEWAAFVRRVLIVAGVAVLAVAVVAAFARAYDIFFLFFLAILLAVLLRAAARGVGRYTGLGAGWSLAAVVLVLLALTAAAGYAAWATVAAQVDQLAANLPKSIDHARAYLQQRPWGRQALEYAPKADQWTSGGPDNAAARVTSFFSTTFGLLGNLLVLAALTVYLAAAPHTYRTGLLTLVPPGRRPRGQQVLAAVEFHLRWWLVGRGVAMLAVGLITGVGLWLIGVPQFLILALLAGLLTAVPFIGPIVASVPGVLLALMQGPDTALWAVGVYLLGQLVENYLVTPLIQQNTVNQPPVLTIAAITLIGALFGVLGLIVATPLAVALMVVVKMLYVEDVLGDQLGVPGADPA